MKIMALVIAHIIICGEFLIAGHNVYTHILKGI